METVATFRKQFAYNDWANGLVLTALGEAAPIEARALKILAHSLVAEKTWLRRLLHDEDTTGFNFWQELSLEDCRNLIDDNRDAYFSLLAGMTDEQLAIVATYRNSKGAEYRTSYRDILTHVLFHSAYHRGQVAAIMRNSNQTPAYTDYIAFVRERDES